MQNEIAMEIGLKFEVIYKDRDLIEVRVSGCNDDFSGVADIYLGRGQAEEIAKQIQGFPQTTSDTREVTLGTFDPQSAGGGLCMQLYCWDESGHAYMKAAIRSGDDSAGFFQQVTISLPVEAAAVDSFVDGLMHLEVVERAHLQGVLRCSDLSA